MYNYLNQAMSGIGGGGAGITSVEGFVMLLANIFVIVAFMLSFISIALSFIQFTTSTGDPKLIEKAQRSLLWGGIGLFISLMAFILKELLINSVGITGLK